MDSVEAFRVPGLTRLRRHEHATVHVCVVLEGGFSEREGSAWRDVPAGTVRVSAAASHDIDFDTKGARCLVLELPEHTGTSRLRNLRRASFLQQDSWLGDVVRRLARTAHDATNEVVVDGLKTEFVAQLERRLDGRSGPPPSWLARVREQLHDTRGALPVAALAREAGVHRVHLARAFREHFGEPVTEYARRMRVAAAHRLLKHSNLPLAAVAAHAGFADQSHMTRDMRALLGRTPGALRRDVTTIQDPNRHSG